MEQAWDNDLHRSSYKVATTDEADPTRDLCKTGRESATYEGTDLSQ